MEDIDKRMLEILKEHVAGNELIQIEFETFVRLGGKMSCKQGIEAMKQLYEESTKWISVKDNPLFIMDGKKRWECTPNGCKEFIGGLYTNKGWWQAHCVVEDEIGLRIVFDGETEPSPWELSDIQYYLLLPEPPNNKP